jgi:hypothetical protein
MCTVAAASGAASVRVCHITSRGWGPWTERPLPEVVRVAILQTLSTIISFWSPAELFVKTSETRQLPRTPPRALWNPSSPG